MHKMDMFLAGGAGAAQGAALLCCTHFHTCLLRQAQLAKAAKMVFAGGGTKRQEREEDGE